MTHPLANIRVLDLTRLIPGAICTMMLADLGADIIKIEDPQGGDYARWSQPQIDGQSVFFRVNNRGKRSIILNLKDERGVAILKKLATAADVLVEGFRPGVMARLGCDYEALQTVNPRLVYCSLSGWGAHGPYTYASGHDLNYATLAGVPGSMATPQVVGGQMGDVGSAYLGVAGITAALFRRERTGEGGYLDVSLSEAVLPFMMYTWVEALTLGTGGGEGVLSGGMACYRIYTTRDNKSVALAALEEKFWINFCDAVERPDLIADHQNPERQRYLTQEVAQIFATKNADEWEGLLSPADCCFTVVRSPGDIHTDPHYQARDALGQFADGTPWMRSPIRLSESQPTVSNTVPGYGEHTREVLAEAGYTAAELDMLIAAGVIR